LKKFDALDAAAKKGEKGDPLKGFIGMRRFNAHFVDHGVFCFTLGNYHFEAGRIDQGIEWYGRGVEFGKTANGDLQKKFYVKKIDECIMKYPSAESKVKVFRSQLN